MATSLSAESSTAVVAGGSPLQGPVAAPGVRARRSSMRERISNIFKSGKKKDEEPVGGDSITPDDFSRNNGEAESNIAPENEGDDVRPSIVIDHGKRRAKDKSKEKDKNQKETALEIKVVPTTDHSRPSSPVSPLELEQKIIVSTPEGQGVLVRQRPDGMVEIHLNSMTTTSTSAMSSPSIISKDLVTVPIEDDKEISLAEFLAESRKFPNKYKLKSRRRSMDVILDFHQRLSSAFDDLEMDIKDMQTNLRKYLRAKEREVISLDDILAEALRNKPKGEPGDSPERSPGTSPTNSPRGIHQTLSGTASRALTQEERDTLVLGLKQVVAVSNSIISALQTPTPTTIILSNRNHSSQNSSSSTSSSLSSSSSSSALSIPSS